MNKGDLWVPEIVLGLTRSAHLLVAVLDTRQAAQGRVINSAHFLAEGCASLISLTYSPAALQLPQLGPVGETF